ncbi:hypothetical protein LTS08_000221 [Lithohypha guttulata]|nr:hypothetical protein LTS08_000221 [Lithohypha guttulata]
MDHSYTVAAAQYWTYDPRSEINGYYQGANHHDTWMPLTSLSAEPEHGLYRSMPYIPLTKPVFCADMETSGEYSRLFQPNQVDHYSSSIDSRSSSPSDISSSNQNMFCTNYVNNSIRYLAGPVNLIDGHIPNSHVETSTHHAPWPTLPERLTSFSAHATMPSLLSTHNLTLKQVEFDQHNDRASKDEFDQDIVTMHTPSLLQNPLPQELETFEASTSSTPGSVSDETTFSEQELSRDSALNSDEEEDLIIVDRQSDSDYTSKATRRRRTSSTGTRTTKPASCRRRGSSILDSNSRVRKRKISTTTTASNHTRRPSRPKAKPKGPALLQKPGSSVPAISKSERSFPCAFHNFGCPAEFPNKNEWKRHVACQHLQLGFYRCDLDDCDPNNNNSKFRARNNHRPKHDEEIIKIYNDFNRKDLFTQHCRRMHGPTRNPALCSNAPTKKGGELKPTKEDEADFEKEMINIRSRCWQVRRKAPARSNCGFCSKVFDAIYYTSNTGGTHDQGPEEKAWEERLEHLGRHYEKEPLRKEQEEIDDDLVAWGLRNGVLRRLDDGRAWLTTADVPDLYTSSVQGAEEDHKRKARRQSSRTVVVQRALAVKKEEASDDDADGEDE